MDLLKRAKEIEKDVIAWRRQLHENPEVGYDLEQTIDFVCQRLDQMGIAYERNKAKSAVIGWIEGGQPGPTIALRADMDALPVREETQLDFQAENGNMHACGHDAHTAILLGAAQLINEIKDQLHGRVQLIFQPAEELGTGSVDIVEKGYLDGVQEILGLHVGHISDEVQPGNFLFAKGPMMACMDKFRVKVLGQGAHGAYPHISVDPVVIAAQIVVAFQEIMGREIEPTEPGVITVGQIHAGTAFNIIPGEALLEGTVRAVTQETREYIARRLEEIASSIATAFRGQIEFDYFWQPPPLVTDPGVTEKAMAVAQKLYPENVHLMTKPVMGGEDFAWYLEEVPGTFVFLSNPMEIDGRYWPHHNSRFALDESQFIKGYSFLAAYIQDQLGS